MQVSMSFQAPPPAAGESATSHAIGQGGPANLTNWSAKLEVADKVQLAINDFGNVARQLVKGSSSQDVRAFLLSVLLIYWAHYDVV